MEAFKMMMMNIHFAYPLVIFAAIIISHINIRTTEAIIGINWGRQNKQRLLPSTVVDLILQNGVHNVRIYSNQVDILQAFAGSGINLTVTVFNVNEVATVAGANAYVSKKSPWFLVSNIRRVFLGNHVFFNGMNDTNVQRRAVDAVNFTQSALNDADYGYIKVTLPQPFQVLKLNITRPSEAEFKDEIKEEYSRFLSIVRANNAPIAIELFPIDIMVQLNITDPGFAFPDKKSTHVVTDVNGAVYTNIVEFAHDAFVWALEKAGAPDVKIIISHIGWPTDGYPGASAADAERFYKCLLPLAASNKGTPKRPGSPLDIYVHALTDENKNPSIIPYGRHWGIYRSNGEPKYKIDLTGQGRDIFPAKARGIMQMPRRWCVVDEHKGPIDKIKLKEQYDYACKNGDCTSTSPGGSCSLLNPTQMVSYAFNMYFQSQFQDEGACVFEGLAKVITTDPSSGPCVFPVEVVRGQQNNLFSADGTHGMPRFPGMFVILLSTLWALY